MSNLTPNVLGRKLHTRKRLNGGGGEYWLRARRNYSQNPKIVPTNNNLMHVDDSSATSKDACLFSQLDFNEL